MLRIYGAEDPDGPFWHSLKTGKVDPQTKAEVWQTLRQFAKQTIEGQNWTSLDLSRAPPDVFKFFLGLYPISPNHRFTFGRQELWAKLAIWAQIRAVNGYQMNTRDNRYDMTQNHALHLVMGLSVSYDEYIPKNFEQYVHLFLFPYLLEHSNPWGDIDPDLWERFEMSPTFWI